MVQPRPDLVIEDQSLPGIYTPVDAYLIRGELHVFFLTGEYDRDDARLLAVIARYKSRGAPICRAVFLNAPDQGEVVRWLADRRPARGRVLDVGCGAGDLLLALRDDGWSVHGVEPSPPGAEQAREKHGLDVVTGRFEQAALPDSSFDVIVFSGVLEHVHDPLGSLRRTHELLAPGGLVAILFLPMLDSPEARLFGPRWLALDLPRHLTHFEDTTFRLMAAKARLEIVGRETYSRRHSAPQLVGSLAPGLQKHRFYRAESRSSDSAGVRARVAPLAKRVAFLVATTAAKPVTRLASAAGSPSLSSYFLVPVAKDAD